MLTVATADRLTPVAGPTIATARLVLRPFTGEDLDPFFALNTHPLVVESLGSSPTRDESDAMVERFGAEMEREGWGLWAVDVASAGDGVVLSSQEWSACTG